MGKLGGIFADASRFRRLVAVYTEEAGALRKPGTPVIASYSLFGGVMCHRY